MTADLSMRVSVAPMMDCTDRHCRYLLRLLGPDIRLYTEMVTAQAIINGEREKLLEFDPAEHPVALQLGGSEPAELEEAVRLAAPFGYDEINLNVGCPSDRVQSGRFGACLMLDAPRVAACVAAMQRAAVVPVSVKTRIGVDDHDSYDFLADFVGRIRDAGCTLFVVHARKAMLSGLSPKQNREIPPLRHDVVYRLKQDFPDCTIVINGGIATEQAVAEHLAQVDGVMIGRQAYANPLFVAALQRRFLSPLTGRLPPADAGQVIDTMMAYAERELARGTRLRHISRHMLGLFSGQPGARAWRRYLSQHAGDPGADASVLRAAFEQIRAAA